MKNKWQFGNMDLAKMFWMLGKIAVIDIKGTEPDQELMIDFNFILPTIELYGTYYPDSEKMVFIEPSDLGESVREVIKEKLMQEVGYKYGN